MRNRSSLAVEDFPDSIPSMVTVGALEEHWARLRLIEARTLPLGHFDYDHMKAIHRHIFQDALRGQARSAVPMGGPMIKDSGPGVSAFPDFDPRGYSVTNMRRQTAADRERDAQYTLLQGRLSTRTG